MVTTVQITSCPECGWRLEQTLYDDGMTVGAPTRCPSARAEGEPCLTPLITEQRVYQNSGGTLPAADDVADLGRIDLPG